MRISVQGFSCPKKGNSVLENEDDFKPRPRSALVGPLRLFRCAVSDGASDASFSSEWARLLTAAYVLKGPMAAKKLYRVLKVYRPLWSHYVASKPLPWYAQAKAENGSFATLLGLTLTSSDDGWAGTWKALAVGDSCMFQVRGAELICSFPLRESGDFGNFPALIPTNLQHDHAWRAALKTDKGRWRPEDSFLLTTDALAQWAFSQAERGEVPWGQFRDVGISEESPAFAEWIDTLRDEGSLRNDDATLLRVDVLPPV